MRILSRVYLFIRKLRHKAGVCPSNCMFCAPSSVPETLCEKLAELFTFRYETSKVLEELPESKLKKFRLEDGILYNDGRLNEDNPFDLRDVEFDVMFDIPDIRTSTYIVRTNSKVFQAYLAFTHLHLVPHAGVVRTERVMLQKIFPLGRYRDVIKRIRKDCTKCKLLSPATTQVKMSEFPPEKTLITPPFYNVQMDVVYGFSGKPFSNARTKVKLYALCIVCISTSATNILCLENISTQDIVNAILRHSSRYGLPTNVFVDNGSQLIAIKHAEFSIRDLDLQLWDKKGVRVLVSRPKAHEDQGKVEVRVKLLREMVKKANVAPSLTQLQLETVFAVISNDMNNIPLCRTDSSTNSSKIFEIITPNRLLLGRNNFRSLHLNTNLADVTLPSKILENNAKIFLCYWQVLLNHFHYFAGRQGKWSVQDPRQIVVGDIVSFLHDDNPVAPSWKLGRVVSIKANRVEIDYRNVVNKQHASMKTCIRSPRDCKIILAESEFAVFSNDYFKDLLKTSCFQDTEQGPVGEDGGGSHL